MSPNPSLFEILNANATVKALMGSAPLRIYPWDRAPENAKVPYAVYAVYNGNPENYLGQVPDIDNAGTQVEIYAGNGASCQACYIAIRNAVEPFAHMTSFSTPALDVDTDYYSARLEFDFWEPR